MEGSLLKLLHIRTDLQHQITELREGTEKSEESLALHRRKIEDSFFTLPIKCLPSPSGLDVYDV
jgi:hypothetical protein